MHRKIRGSNKILFVATKIKHAVEKESNFSVLRPSSRTSKRSIKECYTSACLLERRSRENVFRFDKPFSTYFQKR